MIERECIEWLKRPKGNGYGRTRDGESAHRAVWIARNGPIPEGMHIHHACGNRACVNWRHLQMVTPEEHHAIDPRAYRWGRVKHRCRNRHLLTPENIITHKDGHRRCRKCCNKQQREAYMRRKKRVEVQR